MNRLLDALTLLTRWAVVGLGAILITVVFVQVIFRYFLNDTFFFADELARYLFIWVSFLASSLALRQGAHIGLELNIHSTSRPLRLVAHLCSAAFLGILLITSARLLPAMWDQVAVTLDVRMFWVYLAIPIGALLMLIQLIPVVRESLSSRTHSRQTTPPVEPL